ncbi:hypothetical protein NDU88_006004 [Pleurodeles waltl]|uniref:Uncharacterized protein n=1 Tax=Pleurodeles waltl TaxID=8319 RepID=A0AAV7QJY7_PLEWA|nr:hypothetical protein NDU88_006004 [Pleurodeles waltl]
MPGHVRREAAMRPRLTVLSCHRSHRGTATTTHPSQHTETTLDLDIQTDIGGLVIESGENLGSQKGIEGPHHAETGPQRKKYNWTPPLTEIYNISRDGFKILQHTVITQKQGYIKRQY